MGITNRKVGQPIFSPRQQAKREQVSADRNEAYNPPSQPEKEAAPEPLTAEGTAVEEGVLTTGIQTILQESAERLAILYGNSGEAEQQALSIHILQKLTESLQISGGPQLFENFDHLEATDTPLTLWFTRHIAEQQFTDETMAPLLEIAGYLDSQAESEEPILAFLPDWFHIDGNNRVIPATPRLELARIDSKRNRIRPYQGDIYNQIIHPNLLKTLQNCNYHSAILYSFGLFLTQSLTNVKLASKPAMLDSLSKCRSQIPGLPPELPGILSKIISLDPYKSAEGNCRETLSLILKVFQNNPFHCRNQLQKQIRHQSFGYSVPGMHKKINCNEDQFATSRHENVTFLLVADGVSTADLGSGKIAAEEIYQQLFEPSFQERFVSLADEIERLPAEQTKVWRDKADDLLKDYFLACHVRVTQKLNVILGERPIAGIDHPMCSTLTAAIIFYDQAVFRYLGDSPAWLYCRKNSNCRRLTTDHSVRMAESFIPGQAADTSLTRVIGAGAISGNQFLPSQDPGEAFSLQMEMGDILLLTSDGAIDCLNKGPFQNEQSFLEEVHRYATKETNWNFRKMIRSLVTLGEEGSSHDNITINGIVLEASVPGEIKKEENTNA